jgi:voltage-gated potassium channel
MTILRRAEARLGIRPLPGPVAAQHEIQHFLHRLALLIGLITGLVLAGALGYSVFEDVSYWVGFNWALDTVATIGSIPDPETVPGQITKIVLITFGVGTMFFVLVTMTEFFVAGDLSGLLEARRMQSKISQISEHYLVCGFGRVGQQIARDLAAEQASFIVIDDNPEMRAHAEEMEVLFIEGKGSDDAVLVEAGIDRARGVVACMDSDAENIFTTLSARELRPDVRIVARAASEASERKLLRAGANEVVSPYKASGRTMARLALASHGGRAGPDAARRHGAVVTDDGEGVAGDTPVAAE